MRAVPLRVVTLARGDRAFRPYTAESTCGDSPECLAARLAELEAAQLAPHATGMPTAPPVMTAPPWWPSTSSGGASCSSCDTDTPLCGDDFSLLSDAEASLLLDDARDALVYPGANATSAQALCAAGAVALTGSTSAATACAHTHAHAQVAWTLLWPTGRRPSGSSDGTTASTTRNSRSSNRRRCRSARALWRGACSEAQQQHPGSATGSGRRLMATLWGQCSPARCRLPAAAPAAA